MKDRVYVCEGCGNSIDRDVNAAKNIENEGVRLSKESNLSKTNALVPVECREVKLVERTAATAALRDGKQFALKQETATALA